MSDASAGQQTARLTAFATAGAVTTTQELVSLMLGEVQGADPNVVAEETLCLIALVTARAVEASSASCAPATSEALQELPMLYRDYILGGMMLGDSAAELDADKDVYRRLGRARQFYFLHFPPGQFPGPRALEEKMALWMGRVSPPRLPELPVDRLSRMGLVRRVAVHAKLVLEYARQISDEAPG